MAEQQITFAPHGHILTNTAVWSPDARRIVYDTRSDADGSTFDGTLIQTVDVDTGHIQTLYESRHGACCGVATFHPSADRVVFIRGPEHPDAGWTYGIDRRQGVVVDAARPGVAVELDARDLTPPFTPGALRGGSHVHVFSPDGSRVSFTYDDHILARIAEAGVDADAGRRNIGVSVVGMPVTVPGRHPRNHSGSAFSVLVTRTTIHPTPGSDTYGRAYEEGWVGNAGYVGADGQRVRHAVAFLGDLVALDGTGHAEVFIADLPEALTTPGTGPLAGTAERLPYPPAGVSVRRLTRTSTRKFPGVRGVRHWVRSSPDGSRLAFLMADEAGISQLWTVSPTGGEAVQRTFNPQPVASAFTWSPDGRFIAHVMDGDVCVTRMADGRTQRLTNPAASTADAPLPLACVFSPDGKRIAYLRRVRHADGRRYNQVFVVSID